MGETVTATSEIATSEITASTAPRGVKRKRGADNDSEEEEEKDENDEEDGESGSKQRRVGERSLPRIVLLVYSFCRKFTGYALLPLKEDGTFEEVWLPVGDAEMFACKP